MLVIAPSGAGAVTQVGQTVNPNGSFCSQNDTWLESGSVSNQYVVPFDGVITSWSFLGGTVVPSTLKLKVGKVGESGLTIDSESGFDTPVANTLAAFTARVPAPAGDVIGFYFPSPNGARCAATGQTGYEDTLTNTDIAPGGAPVLGLTEPGGQLDVSALLERDADHDGFGDETQDQCPTNASTQGACPVTPATSAKKKKCKKKHRSAESAKKKKCKKKKHH